MIAETVTVIGGIKTAMDMAKGLSALKSEAEINLAIIDIQRTLLEAQAAAFDDKQSIARLTDEKLALERKLKDADSWETEKRRYSLAKSELGAFFFELRPESANGEVYHRLCATCFESGSKSFLHTVNAHSGGEEVTCQKCKLTLKLAKFVQSSVPRVRIHRS